MNRKLTYKTPNIKIPVTINFCRSSRSNLQTMGIGRSSTRTSKSMFAMPFARKNMTSSMHWPLCDLSQK